MPVSELNEKQLMVVTVSIAGVLVVLLGVGLYIGYSQYTTVKAERMEQEKERNRLLKVKNELPALSERRDRETEAAKAVFALLPNKADVSGLMDEINDKGENTGLQFKKGVLDRGRRRRAGETEQRFRQIAYDWEWSGSFHEIAKFVNKVEDDMDRFLQIAEMSIEAKEGGLVPGVKGNDGHLLKVRMITYQYNQAPAPSQ